MSSLRFAVGRHGLFICRKVISLRLFTVPFTVLFFLVTIGSGDGGEMGMNSLRRRNLYAVARFAEQSPFSPLTQEDTEIGGAGAGRAKRIFANIALAGLCSFLPSYIFLQWSAVTITHAFVSSASC